MFSKLGDKALFRLDLGRSFAAQGAVARRQLISWGADFSLFIIILPRRTPAQNRYWLFHTRFAANAHR